MSPRPQPAALPRAISLDRNSPVPLYFQVAKELERTIVAGELTPGMRLPNEVELGDLLALSRPTIRKAMEYLVDKGMVVRQRGIGTRVVSPKVRRSLQLTSLFDDLVATGQRPTTDVLGNSVQEASPDIAGLLGVVEGAPVIALVRLRSALDQPIARLTNYLPAERLSISTDDLRAHGLYDLLRRGGIHLHSATQVIGARTATAPEARILGERKGAALLTMQRTAFDDHGTIVEHGDHIYSAARYSFHMSLLTA